jgi:MFS family permease
VASSGGKRAGLRGRLGLLAPDVSALRESRDLRLVVLGNFVSGMGTQATLVALPYQIYVETHSALLVGLLGAVELVPLIASALWGGAMADRMDRRTLLLLDQIGLVLVAGALAAVSFAGDPSIPVLYVLAGLLAGVSALQNVVRSAIVPTLVRRELMRSALAFNYGLYQLTMVIGPGLGGVIIATLGVGAAYTIDAVSCFAMVFAVIAIAPLPPKGVERHETIRRSIADGLRFVRGNQALLGSFAIDLVAMTFGMPRALFAVLAVSVYHAGATGTGVLYSAVSLGATVAANHHGLAVAHAEAGAGRDLGCDRVGGGDHVCRACILAVDRGRAARGRRGRGLRQRGMPDDDQPDRHPRPHARPHVFGFLARRNQRPPARRHRVGCRRGSDHPALLGHVGRIGVPGRRGDRDDRVPGAKALRQRRVDRRGRAQSRVSAALHRGPRPRRHPDRRA